MLLLYVGKLKIQLFGMYITWQQLPHYVLKTMQVLLESLISSYERKNHKANDVIGRRLFHRLFVCQCILLRKRLKRQYSTQIDLRLRLTLQCSHAGK